jgi:hypothetical protein
MLFLTTPIFVVDRGVTSKGWTFPRLSYWLVTVVRFTVNLSVGYECLKLLMFVRESSCAPLETRKKKFGNESDTLLAQSKDWISGKLKIPVGRTDWQTDHHIMDVINSYTLLVVETVVGCIL